MTNIYQAAEEAFGTHIVEPYIGMKMKTGKKYNELHDKIYQEYKKDPNVVNDQALLFGRLFEPLWDYSLTPTENLIKLTRDSNVCRRRQELHEAGLIEYSKKATKSREKAMRNERDKASPIPPQISKYELMTINGERVMKKLDKEELWKKAQKVAKNWPSVTPEQTRLI